jgi:hypothetical protein
MMTVLWLLVISTTHYVCYGTDNKARVLVGEEVELQPGDAGVHFADDTEQDAQQSSDKKKKTFFFNSCDPRVIELLPRWITEQLPFKATPRGAIDKTLLTFMNLLFMSVGTVAGVRARLTELAHEAYFRNMLLYYEAAAYLFERDNRVVTAADSNQTTLPFREAVPSKPHDFGLPTTGDSHIYVPSEQYLMSMFLSSCHDDAQYQDRYMAQLGGEVIKCDHTFAIAKKVVGKDRERLFAAVFTFMNEYCQPIGQWFTEDKSLANPSLHPQLELMAKRFESENIQVMCTPALCVPCTMFAMSLIRHHCRLQKHVMWMTQCFLKPSCGV